ncbi:MAG: bifunctional phosphopantothenoylcysteine decarboxylase/phosphopantothenate--cysteine ligase CoaBC [Spirosomataceae bacterium]
MKSLQSKKILLGVTGSIAAYKSAHLIRLLVKSGAEVKVVMTDQAREFITPLTLSTLSKNPVLTSFTVSKDTGAWNNHVELALWADALLIAPATAQTIAKCAHGLCDNLLQAIYLSMPMRGKVFFAPAMDLDMLKHPATEHNLNKIKSFGQMIIEPGFGELASGLIGQGRMAEPEQIVTFLEQHFALLSKTLKKKVLITAGPTQEDLDPVRFISNHSSGKMGYALAEAFVGAGCNVTLVSGPVNLNPPPGTKIIQVRSAEEMLNATLAHHADCDLIIFAAAVADYTPVYKASQKIKKGGNEFHLELKKTPDIAATIGEKKKPGQLLLGFALETENEIENARAKLRKKNLDWVVLNSLNEPGAGFGHDTNKIVVIDGEGQVKTFALKSKREVAVDIMEIVREKWQEN